MHTLWILANWRCQVLSFCFNICLVTLDPYSSLPLYCRLGVRLYLPAALGALESRYSLGLDRCDRRPLSSFWVSEDQSLQLARSLQTGLLVVFSHHQFHRTFRVGNVCLGIWRYYAAFDWVPPGSPLDCSRSEMPRSYPFRRLVVRYRHRRQHRRRAI